MTTTRPAVGFIGLGAMGSAMATRLLDQAFAVTAWNRSERAVLELTQHERATAAETPAAVFAAAPVVHSMLADDEALLTLFSDELLASIPTGRVHVNHATISPAAARELADRHERHAVGYVQAPVLGRSTIAATGGLLVVASGDPESVAAAMPSLEALGQRTWNLGADVTMASVVKIAVNYSLISAMQSIAESVALVEAAGIDSSEFVQILTHTAFSGAAHKGYAPIIAEQRYQPVGFAMSLGLKDLGLAEQAAADRGVSLPIAPVLHELFEAAAADPELRELDWSAVAEVTRRRSGLTPER
ncbi:MAG: NAD(P)-dependent oxidoreductase [Microcella sp.]|uniref:NAD(P)-dependent oxidoreductase n=1 Tax=Microcella sp. TaxID=1913979 RepID=UPI0024CD394B|nr:NAD(P)-dependent oxidoreductase [Microcella sp.]UYN82663.1 MAG: NAD(P)-dependent oxidoreductase [Microcella sp.]